MILNSPTISGSLTVTGSLTVFTGSLIEFQVLNTGTKIGNAITDIHTVTGSLSVSGSQTFIGTKTITGSVFISGSKTLIGTNTVSGSMLVSGSLNVNGPITATTLIVQTITSSVSTITGSTNFGTLSSNNHIFTGSMYVTGAFYVSTGSVGIGTVSPSQKLEVVGGEIKAGRVDSSQEGGQVSFGRASDNNTSWYIDLYGSSTSPQLRFVDVDNSAVRMTLTGSNVGIGTSSPTQPLHVYATSTTTSTYFETNSANSYIGLKSTSGINYIGNVSYAMTFEAGGAERMRITSAGNVGIPGILEVGTTGLNGKIGVYFSGASKVGIDMRDADDASNVNFLFFRKSNGTGIGSINRAGLTDAVSYTTTSDYRLKEDLKDFNGLEKISAIKVYDFKWKSNEERTNGVLAHELAEVLSYAVHGEKDGLDRDGNPSYQGVDYSKIVPLLVKAIQELKAQNDDLQSQINELKAQ
jgi:hypothetical protein